MISSNQGAAPLQRSDFSPRARGRVYPRSLAAVARSLLLYTLTFFAVATLVFALPQAMPGDPLTALQDPSSSIYVTDNQVRDRLLAHYGLDRPLAQQYASYLGGIARGDLGWSFLRNTPVLELVQSHLPWTLLLMGTSLAATSVLSFLGGVTAAWKRGRLSDRLLLGTITGIEAVPPYALAALLLIVFAVLLPVFPLSGGRTAFATYTSPLSNLTDIARHLALPATALTLSLIGSTFLLVRNAAISSLGQDYMVLARAKGLPERLLKYRHAGRNALLPFLTALATHSALAIGAVIFIEPVFAYPGIASLILPAVAARDYPVLEGTFLVLALLVLTINFLLEMIYARLDPAVRAE